MGRFDTGLRAAGGIAKKARLNSKTGAAAGGAATDRKGQHSIEFHKSKGQHILKKPLVRVIVTATQEHDGCCYSLRSALRPELRAQTRCF